MCIRDRFCAMQDTIQVFVTQYAGHAKKLAKASGGCCYILVCICLLYTSSLKLITHGHTLNILLL